jgi:hypothetical protein
MHIFCPTAFFSSRLHSSALVDEFHHHHRIAIIIIIIVIFRHHQHLFKCNIEKKLTRKKRDAKILKKVCIPMQQSKTCKTPGRLYAIKGIPNMKFKMPDKK